MMAGLEGSTRAMLPRAIAVLEKSTCTMLVTTMTMAIEADVATTACQFHRMVAESRTNVTNTNNGLLGPCARNIRTEMTAMSTLWIRYGAVRGRRVRTLMTTIAMANAR